MFDWVLNTTMSSSRICVWFLDTAEAHHLFSYAQNIQDEFGNMKENSAEYDSM